MSDVYSIPPYIAITLVDWGLMQGISKSSMAEALSLGDVRELSAEKCQLSANDYEQLLTLLYQQTGQQQLGLLIGASINIADYGVLGHAMLSAATVGEAIHLGLEYYRLTSSFMTLTSSTDDENFHITARLDYDLAAIRQFAPEELLLGLTQVARQLLGEDFSPITVHFNTAKPDYSDDLARFFRCPMVFEQELCRFVLAKNLLSLPLKTANALTASQLLRLCQSLLQTNPPKIEDDLLTKVRAVIKAKVNVWPTMVTVAKVLGLSERTLRRRLEALGTDYQQQVELVRQQLAKQLIANHQVSVEQVAAVLGYSEAASFRRAFHRWWGMSPQLYRQETQIGR